MKNRPDTLLNSVVRQLALMKRSVFMVRVRDRDRDRGRIRVRVFGRHSRVEKFEEKVAS